jgi:hypothetical protein
VTGLIEDDDVLLKALTSFDVGPTVIGDSLEALGWSILRDIVSQESGQPVAPRILGRAPAFIYGRVAEIRAGRASASELSGFY